MNVTLLARRGAFALLLVENKQHKEFVICRGYDSAKQTWHNGMYYQDLITCSLAFIKKTRPITHIKKRKYFYKGDQT